MAFESCKKTDGTVTPNPNLVGSCVISSTQVVVTDLHSQQIHSYVNSYQYDGQYRLVTVSDGQNNDVDHYQYHGNDCDGDHNTTYHNSAQGYVLTSSDHDGTYVYSYDGNGYVQLEQFTDSTDVAHNYIRSYYWDNNDNLSYSVKQIQGQTTPITTTYSYYTDKAAQTLIPSNWLEGHMSSNLVKQAVVSSGSTVISSDSYSYVFDSQGKVAQYTILTAGQKQTVYTLTYSCH